MTYHHNFASEYDFLHIVGLGKDYRSESARVVELVSDRIPKARTLLDVGCGTGRHLEILRRHYQVEGVELAPEMFAYARERLPGIRLHCSDMRTLNIGKQFDVITCLFSVIAYAGNLESVRATIGRLCAHLRPGGVLILEPWVFAENWHDGKLNIVTVETRGRTLVLLTRSETDGDQAVYHMEFLAGTPDEIRHFASIHRLALLTYQDLADALAESGCSIEYLPPNWAGLNAFCGAGLFIGVRRDPSGEPLGE